MQRNYTPSSNKVSMNANDIKRDQHQSINDQIDAFFSRGRSIQKVEPNRSALVGKPAPAAPFVINAELNAKRQNESKAESSPCS